MGGFELLCMSVIALLFGAAVCFLGYRFFLIMIPIIGFFWGLALGAQTIQALFGDAFFATITSWVVGFVVAVVFALLSYFFYFIAVALIAGALGYGLVVGLLGAIGLDMNFITWLIGIVVGVALAVVTLRFNLQKWVIIAATSYIGALTIIGTFLLAFGKISTDQIGAAAVRAAIADSWLWILSFIVLVVAGIVVQVLANRRYVVAVPENRLYY
jgi:hypothetical protein